MRYMVMIYNDESREPAQGSPEAADQYAAYMAFGEEAGRRGAIQGGERLHPISAAKTLRIRDGAPLTTDGPYAETKEQLGGYYILECKSEAEVLELAAMIPGARTGSIEVRPIWEM